MDLPKKMRFAFRNYKGPKTTIGMTKALQEARTVGCICCRQWGHDENNCPFLLGLPVSANEQRNLIEMVNEINVTYGDTMVRTRMYEIDVLIIPPEHPDGIVSCHFIRRPPVTRPVLRLNKKDGTVIARRSRSSIQRRWFVYLCMTFIYDFIWLLYLTFATRFKKNIDPMFSFESNKSCKPQIFITCVSSGQKYRTKLGIEIYIVPSMNFVRSNTRLGVFLVFS